MRSPAGRNPSRQSDANATALAATWSFMSSAPRPQISPSTRSPDHGSRDHSSGVRAHGVGVGEQRERRPVAARQPRDEIEPVGRAADELARDAVPLEVVAQQLGRDRLVPRRVDGVHAEQLLQERRHLLAEGHDSAWDFAVSSLRTSHSSGYSTRWISRPSTSTGVPWVPITCSPITRATTR